MIFRFESVTENEQNEVFVNGMFIGYYTKFNNLYYLFESFIDGADPKRLEVAYRIITPAFGKNHFKSRKDMLVFYRIIMSTEDTQYWKNGYSTRMHYLQCVAEDHGVPLSAVLSAASILGPNEDFDGLITAIEDGDLRLLSEDGEVGD